MYDMAIAIDPKYHSSYYNKGSFKMIFLRRCSNLARIILGRNINV